MKRIGLEKVSVVLIILALLLGSGSVWAEEYGDESYYEAEEGSVDTPKTPSGYNKGKKVGWDGAGAPPGLVKKAELKKLKELKEENPEKFKQVVENRKNVLENRLQKIKENNPEKFKEIVQKRKTNQAKRLQHLKKTNPEKYKAVLKKNLRLRDHAEDVRVK